MASGSLVFMENVVGLLARLKWLEDQIVINGGPGISQLTGDVTAGPGGGSQVATIGNSVITFAKFQDIPTNTLVGRDAPLTGVAESITVGGGLTFTGTQELQIATNGVDNTKLAQMATQTFKGRNTAGSGDPEDLSVATVQTMLSITTELQLVKMRITAAARM